MVKIVKAALIVIGDEILSGRTQDQNIQYLASFLGEMGISLAEVRVISDIHDEIVSAVNVMRAKFDYLFTTGGIGPTHDDITAESIALAFDVPLEQNKDAYKILADYYGEENFTDARKRMTRVPRGGALIKNTVSLAPGFQMENVFTLAGVPKIMQAMLEDIRPKLEGGTKVHSRDMTIEIGESLLTDCLIELESTYPLVSIGSYPFYGEGRPGVQIVIRSTDQSSLDQAMESLRETCIKSSFPVREIN